MNNDQNEAVQKAVYKDEKTQEELNAPLSDPTGIDAENTEFMELVVSFINKGKIDLYKPDTLINHEFYDTLLPEKQGKADFEAVNLVASLREIKGLYDAGFKNSYQMQNLLHRIRNTKERIEEKSGDIFII